jgi:putative acetyltransferase
MSDVEVRAYLPGDAPAIREINRAAFRMAAPGAFEKQLQRPDALARVAANRAGQVLGHIIFAEVVIAGPRGPVHGMGLGELAVASAHQRRGIGTRLARAGLDAVQALGCPFCIVIGHASYYPRFGFVRGSLHGLRCQWDKVPEASFMVRILDERAMRGVSGVARYIDIA